MSGFVGIVNIDGTPVDRSLLEQMTGSLEFRGPDAKGIWCDQAIGLGHTLLRTTEKAAPDGEIDKQPATIDGCIWIVADARIDARPDLIKKLNATGSLARALSLATPDFELILHAYETWGDACVEYLLGDFSFAIWDAQKRWLFCARDQFGVKPFFYAHVGSCIIFSNTLDCIRKHPLVSNRLNDLAIADFLVFEMNQDPTTTAFADIRRLPPAHTLTYKRESLTIRRYWQLSVTTPIHFHREREYIEHFLELLDAAVADRVRTRSVGVLMSGGLDSTTVAASAKRVLDGKGNDGNLRAYTEVFDSLIPHEERYFAKIAAEALGMPIEFFVCDHWNIFERAKLADYCPVEPIHTALHNTRVDQLREVAARSTTALTGYGGDPALCGRISVHFHQLIETKQIGRMLADTARFLTAEGRLSRLYLRTRWRILFASKSHAPFYPQWLNPELEKRLGLRDRWESMSRSEPPAGAARPEAHEAMVAAMWPNLFEMCDAGITRVAVEVSHPIFDLRLVNFLLALPRMPWCSDKELLREACRDVLPDVVRLRRKSPMPADQLVAVLSRPESAWVDRFEPVLELGQYVVRNRIPAVYREQEPWTVWINLRALSLNYWLRGYSE